MKTQMITINPQNINAFATAAGLSYSIGAIVNTIYLLQIFF